MVQWLKGPPRKWSLDPLHGCGKRGMVEHPYSPSAGRTDRKMTGAHLPACRFKLVKSKFNEEESPLEKQSGELLNVASVDLCLPLMHILCVQVHTQTYRERYTYRERNTSTQRETHIEIHTHTHTHTTYALKVKINVKLILVP